MARGSLEETKYHLLLARDLGYLKEDLYQNLQSGHEEIGKMLSGLIKSLQT
ncbi:MAG: four helix bundle protein [bacterium]|nr:four helix bundle protein [bacterium]